jgi:tricorn protease
MKNFFFFSILFFAIAAQITSAQINAKMFQYPDVSQTHITFTYAGDVWIVSKNGGTANKLTSAKGTELLARFSPDGKQIAFSGNYNGNIDVYVMPSLGGLPKELHHGMGDRIIDWYPDGSSLLFASSRESGKQRLTSLQSLKIRRIAGKTSIALRWWRYFSRWKTNCLHSYKRSIQNMEKISWWNGCGYFYF